MPGGRGVSTASALAANVVVLYGILVAGWSVWTMVAAFWLELLLETPFLAIRIERALPALTPEALERYLETSDRLITDVHPEGGQVRGAISAGGLVEGARMARRLFLGYWGPFLLFPGLFMVIFGGIAGMLERGGQVPDLGEFDLPGLLVVGAAVLAGEAATLFVDRRSVPAMPAVDAFQRRFVVISLTVVFGGFLVGIFRATVPVGELFLTLKTIADVRTGHLPHAG
jgi:hypothetical protein